MAQMNLLLHGLESPQIDPLNSLRFPMKEICDKAVASIASVHGKVYKSGSKYETIYPSSGIYFSYFFEHFFEYLITNLIIKFK